MKQCFHIVPILGGLADPFSGVFTALLGLFWSPRLLERADTPRRRLRGITFVLGGVEGPSSYSLAMAIGVLKAGYRGSVARFSWNRGFPFWRVFRNLMDRRHHERQSDALAAKIVRHQLDFPGSPVCLFAQSGGCWITLRALEKLPPGCEVQTVVWLAPSISPNYDLTAAVAKCRENLISVGGPGDFFFLGLGTSLLGTSDRVHSPSAGWTGWLRHPPGLVEVRWRSAWIKHGYLGNHATTSAVGFIQHVVAPWLRTTGDQPTPRMARLCRCGEQASHGMDSPP
jgi:hypothetical protein